MLVALNKVNVARYMVSHVFELPLLHSSADFLHSFKVSFSESFSQQAAALSL